MTYGTKQLIKASLVSPLLVIPISVLYSIYYSLTWIGKDRPSNTLMFPDPFRPWESVLLFSLYGVPIAYICMTIIGLPCYFCLRKLKSYKYISCCITAILACIPVAVLYGGSHSFFKFYTFLLLFGIPISLLFTFLVSKQEVQTAQWN